MDIDLDELIALVELLKDTEFSEFKYEKGDLRIVIRRGGRSYDQEPLPQRTENRKPPGGLRKGTVEQKDWASEPVRTQSRAVAVEVLQGAVPVTSPLLGTFYTRPKPGETPFVSVGSQVEADTVVCIIEVMKLMNSVVAGIRGVVAAVHANEGGLVEHGQLLFSITPLPE